jgi:hypothetical protein
MSVPLQSPALAAVLNPLPRITGKAALRDVEVAAEYEEDVKRRRMDSVAGPSLASYQDSKAAKVRTLLGPARTRQSG